jgi:hypothetical protein
MPNALKISINKSLLEKKVPFIKYVYVGLVANLVLVLALLAIHSFLPPQIPLFYGSAEGEGQLAPSWAIIIPNLSAILASFVNTALCLLVKDEFLKKTLVIASLGISLLATITVAKIILIVGSFNI